MKKRHQQKLVILSISLFVLFNAPVLLLFNSADHFMGFPIIYGYIFIVWTLSVLSSFIIFKKFHE
ncbi:hypothetical protein OA86_01405 [Kaistella jeonii]|uniref:DUF3311 domain-containing protein n=1 Tax=Kaistella jeonii TaxID=266749 RepID=A0A0C1FBX7_9FLAO|nr:hypothetical protein OA86_01405 [Kaistella jeonii]